MMPAIKEKLSTGLISGKRLIITDDPDIEPCIEEKPTLTIDSNWRSRLSNWNRFNYFDHTRRQWEEEQNIKNWTANNWNELNGFNSEDDDWKRIDEWQRDVFDKDPYNISSKTEPVTDLCIEPDKLVDLVEILNFVVYGNNINTQRNNWQINRELQKLKTDVDKDLLYLNYDNIEYFIKLLQQEFLYIDPEGTKLRSLCVAKIIDLLDEDINIFIDHAILFTNKSHKLKIWYFLYFSYKKLKTTDIVILYDRILSKIEELEGINNFLYKELHFINNHIENVILIKNLKHAKEWSEHLKLKYAISNIEDLIERQEHFKELSDSDLF